MVSSRCGLALLLPRLATSGTIVRVKLDSNDRTLATRLKNRDLTSFNVEVRWSNQSGAGFLHGLLYKTVAEGDREFLLQCILESQEKSDREAASLYS